MFNKIKNLDPMTKSFVKACAAHIAVAALTVVVVEARAKKSNA